jgi:histidinol-phosphate/aromatic aminotransferase/cobyric acid decarboxylase-like protein
MPVNHPQVRRTAITSILPEGEALRRAVQWISDNREWTQEAVQEAGVMFDLTPLEEQFLIDQFVHHQDLGDQSKKGR